LAILLFAIGGGRELRAQVVDALEAGAPSLDSGAPQPASLQAGGHGISEQTGAVSYSYPLAVPPGRQEMQPSLSLDYSSRAPLRGGIAAGWSLGFPSIDLDTSSGTLDAERFTASLGGASGRLVEVDDTPAHDGATYRLEQDDAFVIFERFTGPGIVGPHLPDVVAPGGVLAKGRERTRKLFGGLPKFDDLAGIIGDLGDLGIPADPGDVGGIPENPGHAGGGPGGVLDDLAVDPGDLVLDPQPAGGITSWVARTPDGKRHYFGSTTASTDGETRWYLDRQVDPFGNTVVYRWERVTGASGRLIDFAISGIEYTKNAAAGLEAHARVAFEYAPLESCPGSEVPIGASLSFRSGRRYVEGARRLVAIVTSVRDEPGVDWREVRRVSLSYDAEALRCDGAAAPLRLLVRIDMTAVAPDGEPTSALPISFEYGAWDPSMPESRTIGADRGGDVPAHHGTNLDLDSTLLDVNGDGILDRVEVRAGASGDCELVWLQGRHGGGWAAGFEAVAMRLPTMPWSNGAGPTGNERCTLMGQITYRHNLTPLKFHCHIGNLNIYQFLDLDADGDLDLLSALESDPALYDPAADPALDPALESLGGPAGGAPLPPVVPVVPVVAPVRIDPTVAGGQLRGIRERKLRPRQDIPKPGEIEPTLPDPCSQSPERKPQKVSGGGFVWR
ncbi:MAG: hypothetical protein L0227_19970, partial [Chloroflexi bacterium]|nr:hypothetical protein [Chloroflexota bacterium]